MPRLSISSERNVTKPTYGRVSRYGLVAFGSSLDQIGPFTNSVEDAALAMDVLGRHCDKDATSLHIKDASCSLTLKDSIEGKTIGVPRQYIQKMNPDVLHNFNESLKTLESLGCKIVDVHLEDLKYAIPVYYVLAPAEASTNLARFD